MLDAGCERGEFLDLLATRGIPVRGVDLNHEMAEVGASGFTKATIEFRSPVPEQDRLQPIAVPAGAPPAFSDLTEAFNANVEKLNSRIFTYLDYAVIGDKAL